MTTILCMVPEKWSATDRIFLSFWTIFCPFIPLTTPKIKIKKKRTKGLEISSFHICVPRIIICYLPETWHVMDVVVIFHFGLFFAPFNPLTAQKIILKKWKKCLEIPFYTHFTQVYQKSWSYAILFLRYGTWWM